MKKKDQQIAQLMNTISSMESPEECLALFEDLCTIKELQDMAGRLETVFLLSEGKNYQEITAQTGISSATISRVKRCLEYGAGGYVNAIKKSERGSADA